MQILHGNGEDHEKYGGWSGSQYLAHAGNVVLDGSMCLETDIIALEAHANSVIVYHRIA